MVFPDMRSALILHFPGKFASSSFVFKDVTAVLQPFWHSIGCLVRVQLSNSGGTLGLES